MGLLVALGEAVRVGGFALAGATVLIAESPEAVCRAWTSLPRDVSVVVLTPQAAGYLADAAIPLKGVMTAVMPP